MHRHVPKFVVYIFGKFGCYLRLRNFYVVSDYVMFHLKIAFEMVCTLNIQFPPTLG